MKFCYKDDDCSRKLLALQVGAERLQILLVIPMRLAEISTGEGHALARRAIDLFSNHSDFFAIVLEPCCSVGNPTPHRKAIRRLAPAYTNPMLPKSMMFHCVKFQYSLGPKLLIL